MCFGAHLLHHVNALLSEGGVNNCGDLGGALLLLHTDLLLVALLGGCALLLGHTLGLVMALLVLGTLLLRNLVAHLLLDRVHDVAALLFGVGGALLPGNLPRHGLALLHGPAATLLLVLCLVVGHTPRGADWFRDCGAGGAGDCVVNGVALWCYGDCRGMVSYSNCRGVVSYSNVAVAVGMPAMVAIGMVSIPGVGFSISFSISQGQWGHSSKEENKLLDDYCW